MITGLSELTASQKDELVASLSYLLVGSAESEDGVTADKLQSVASTAGNTLSPALATLFASVVGKAKKGVDGYCTSPGGGGGGGAAAGGDAAAAAEAQPEEKEEEEEMDMGGGMDMFGGDEGEGGGDY
jgi:ribosomal protein L12E/L44/L45/RPP1/RPP2